jgi:hypothetical protein
MCTMATLDPNSAGLQRSLDRGHSRRIQARDLMSSSLRERTLLKRNRSFEATSARTKLGRSCERKVDLPSCRGGLPPSPAFFSNNPTSDSIPTRIATAITHRRTPHRTDASPTKTDQHKLTLRDLTRFLGPECHATKARLCTGGLTCVNLDRNSQSVYPNISLTIQAEPTRVVVKRVKPRRQAPAEDAGTDQAVHLPTLVRPSTVFDPRLLAEADAAEWTRRWVLTNPLGPANRNTDGMSLSEEDRSSSRSSFVSHKKVHFSLNKMYDRPRTPVNETRPERAIEHKH